MSERIFGMNDVWIWVAALWVASAIASYLLMRLAMWFQARRYPSLGSPSEQWAVDRRALDTKLMFVGCVLFGPFFTVSGVLALIIFEMGVRASLPQPPEH